jgi:hypothetical protein
MSQITLLAGSTIGVVFGWGALAKMLRFPEWRHALEAYDLPVGLSLWARVGVPVAELVVVGMLVSGHARAGAALTLTLLALFSLALFRAGRKGGDLLPCGCFGGATPRDYRLLIGRNGGLAFFAGVIMIGSRDRLVSADLSSTSALLPAALVVVGVMVLVWMGRELSAVMRRS